jgi:hypothetical protein
LRLLRGWDAIADLDAGAAGRIDLFEAQPAIIVFWRPADAQAGAFRGMTVAATEQSPE